jgi:hypothetical protein
MNAAIPVVCVADTGVPLTCEQIDKCFTQWGVSSEHTPPVKERRRTARAAASTEIPCEVEKALTSGRPTERVKKRLDAALRNCFGTDRHSHVRDDALVLLRYGKQGEPGVDEALGILGRQFAEKVGPDRSGGQAEAEEEFNRFIFSTRVEEMLAEPDIGAPEPDAEFWSRTEVLSHILRFARSRGAAPYPVLAAVLRRGVGCIDPYVLIPPIVGGAASLNLFTAPVGASGGGKDAANAAGHDGVNFFIRMGDAGRIAAPEAHYIHPGSGEGLVRSLMPDDASPSSGRGHLQVPDVATLEALADRKGQTLSSLLLAAYMGQPIGFRNNSKSTSTAIDAHTYRLCLSVGVQPDNAAFFLSREKDGLPQRFLWSPTTDPNAPFERPEPVEPLAVTLPSFPGDHENPFMLAIPAAAKDEIWEYRWRSLRGEGVDPLDAHIRLTRLKVAAALAIVHGYDGVTDEMWELAGHLIEVSAKVRTELCEASAAKRRRENSARARDQADRQTIIEAHMTDQRHQRVVKAIRSKLQRVGAAERRNLQQACDSSIRADFRAVFDLLLDQHVLVMEGGNGDRTLYRLADG